MKKRVLGSVFFVLFVAVALPLEAQVTFGSASAVGGGEVFVGEGGNLVTPGYVYVYRPGSGGWVEAARLTRSDARDADGFGNAIAYSDGMLLIGATDVGAAYVFRREGGEWIEAAQLTASDGADGDGFGNSVALNGDLAIIGAPRHNGGEGAAYLFRRSGDSWSQVAKLVGDGSEPSPAEGPPPGPERFGVAVTIDDDTVAVGAPGGDGDLFLAAALGASGPVGNVYVFQQRGGTWERGAKLSDETIGQAAALGTAVVLQNNELMIGAPGANGLVGRVIRFRYSPDADQWNPAVPLAPFDPTPGTFFGVAISFNETEVFVGAPGAVGSQGRIYRFRREPDSFWTGATTMGTVGLGQFAGFASSVAASGNTLVAGIPGDDFGAGSATIMTRDHDGWDRTRVISATSGLDPIVGDPVECVNGYAGIFECNNIDLVAFLPVHLMGGGRGVGTNDVWGWTDPESGHDYALVGMRERTSFVDVTDVNNPVWVGSLLKSDGAPPSLWRDIKVQNDHAYIVSDNAGPHGVQVFDLTRLREFDGEPIMFTEKANYSGISSAHNIVINEDEPFAYVVGASGGGETCGGGLHIINIEDPNNPVFVGCFSATGTGRVGTGYSHDAMCVTYRGPDERYQGHEICIGSNETTLSIADVTDKRNPLAVGVGEYPNTAYTHQGWIADDHRYFYANDEADEVGGLTPGTRTLIFDIQELDDPILVGEYVTDSPATDHNLYVKGDLMYQSNYRSGLRVVDISDPEALFEYGFFDTVPWGANDGMGDIVSGAIGSWSNYPYFDSGVVVVTSGREGLFIVRVREPN